MADPDGPASGACRRPPGGSESSGRVPGTTPGDDPHGTGAARPGGRRRGRLAGFVRFEVQVVLVSHVEAARGDWPAVQVRPVLGRVDRYLVVPADGAGVDDAVRVHVQGVDPAVTVRAV